MMQYPQTPDSLDIPAAWRGDDLLARADWQQILSDGEADELERAVHDWLGRGREVHEATAMDFLMPQLGRRLEVIQRELEQGSGATLVRGIPIERFDERQATCAFWAIVSHLGTPVSQTARGDTLFHVRDEGLREGQAEARGPNTRKKLSFHTDRCDVIAFLCLRQARSGGENQLVSSPSLYNEIRRERPDLLEELLQPYLYQRHSVDTANALPYCRQPVFSFCEGHFAGCFLRVLIDRAHRAEGVPSLTDRQIEALDFLEEVAERPELHVQFRQERGDVLLVNNWVNFHRRFEFEDHEDPELKRHLLRVWLAVPNSRPLDPCFLDNYGAVEAGAVRGGMPGV